MLCLGFRGQWVELIMRCVQTTSFSFLINGVPCGHVIPSPGIRQRDPISPYLFLFCSEGLLGLLRKATEERVICGYQICEEAPPISHLLFADDTIIFCGAEELQAEGVRHILLEYEQASGQVVNFNQTNVMFSKGVKASSRRRITHSLDIRKVLLHDKYSGLPNFVGRSRKKAFLFIIDRIKKQLSSWMDRLVSWAGKEVLIKVVAQAIPTYVMSVFRFQQTYVVPSKPLLIDLVGSTTGGEENSLDEELGPL